MTPPRLTSTLPDSGWRDPTCIPKPCMPIECRSQPAGPWWELRTIGSKRLSRRPFLRPNTAPRRRSGVLELFWSWSMTHHSISSSYCPQQSSPAASETTAAGGVRQFAGTPPEVAEDNPVAASTALLRSGG